MPTPSVRDPIHPDPLAGTAYRALSFLGQGSFGLVLEAQHVALATVVVVKLLHAHLADRPDLVDRLRLEAQAMSRLRSPHLTLCTDLAVTPEGRPRGFRRRLRGSYRAALVESDTPWAQAPILDGFLDLGLYQMRIHEGMADLMFPGLAIVDVMRVMTLALAVERAAGGKPLPTIVRGPGVDRRDMRDHVKTAWVLGGLAGILVAVVAGTPRRAGPHFLEQLDPRGLASGPLVGCLITLGLLVRFSTKSGEPS